MNELLSISLFSGIGGDTIAAQWAGFKTLVFVENDKFCQKILKKHWPNIPIWSDINDFKAEKYRGDVTLVHGGDPCQPNSVAGKRRGEEDDRYLWPQMLRVVHECQPTWVVNENPTGRLTMDFYEVLLDLEGEGYEVWPVVIPACAVNAPHRRDRLYIVAHRKVGQSWEQTKSKRWEDIGGGDKQITSDPNDKRQPKLQGCEQEGGERTPDNPRPIIADSECKPRLQGHENEAECNGREAREVNSGDIKSITDSANDGFTSPRGTWSGWQGFENGDWNESWIEVATALCGVDDGLPDRVARLKALGNAQVPQQIYPIFKAIADIEKAMENHNTLLALEKG